jgi:hypothetical protein
MHQFRKEKARLAEIISKVNDLFEGDLPTMASWFT